MRTYRGLSAAYAKLRDYEKAFVSFRAYTQLLKQQLEQRNQEATQRFQVQFETQKFAASNERLELMNKSQKQELEHRKALLKMQYMVIALAIGVIGLVAILWWRSRQHARKMQLLATTDELTGLLNRRAIMQFGTQEWRRADRFKRPLCCLVFDVDHFKSINDTLGHAAGDQVLKTISKEVKSILRQTDSLGRFGGEEFLLIATETDINQAEALAERIRHEIESIRHEGIDRVITVSIGVAQLTDEASPEELIRHADEALYEAKNNGRNRVVVSKTV
jgi:diguanylate cyclase (GGDEF)-like protein